MGVIAFEPNIILVKATVAQSLPQGIDTVITFSASPVFQIGNGLTYNGSNTVTINRAGYYELTAYGAIDDGDPGYSRIIAIFVNGSVVKFINNPGYIDAGSGTTWRNFVTTKIPLAENDTVQVKMRFEDPNHPVVPQDTNPSQNGVTLYIEQMLV